MKTTETMITLKDITKIYYMKSIAGEVVCVLDGINPKVSRGSIRGIVGQSGAGRPTLIRCLTALEQPTEGPIAVGDQEMTALSGPQLHETRCSIGMVFQTVNLLDSRTAAGNVACPSYLSEVPRGKRHEQVMCLLELVGLKDRVSSYPSQLSGEQKQCVDVARGLVTNPPVLLYDEPTSTLGQESTSQVLQLIRRLHGDLGVTVIIITHEVSVIREICDSVALLKHGKIIQSGAVEEISVQPNSRLVLELVPLSHLDETLKLNGRAAAVIGIALSSTSGKPIGSAVVGLVATRGADMAVGASETVGVTQVGCLALAVLRENVSHLLTAMRSKGTDATGREIETKKVGDLFD